MLIIEPRGGLCNRMRVLDGARELARSLGQPLTVVWRLDHELGASFEDLFEPLAGIDAWHDFDCRTAAGSDAYGRFVTAPDKTVLDMEQIKQFVAQDRLLDALKGRDRLHVQTWHRLYPTENPFSDFRPRPHLLKRIAAITTGFDRTMGVHLRRSDSDQSIKNSPTIGFVARMRRALERGETENFFLATDDQREEKTLLAAFPGRIIHQPKRSLDREEAEAIEDAVVDLYCLAATKKLLGSFFSSFSDTAASIGGITCEIIGESEAASPGTRAAPVLTFGIPLKTVLDPVERRFRSRMLSATLASIYGQTDGAFRVLLAGSHPHDIDVPVDDRLEYLQVDAKPATDLGAAREDAARKTQRIVQAHMERGGGPLMLVDMDDFVSNRLVAFVRANPHPNGYLVDRGYALNVRSSRFAPCDQFHKRCGTSSIINLGPGEADGPDSRFSQLRNEGHYMVAENAAAEGRPLMPLPFPAAVWVLNHGGNLTWLARKVDLGEKDGPRQYLDEIDRTGSPASQLGAEFAVPERYPLLDAYFSAMGRSPPPSLSVVITTYRRPAGLRRLLSALAPQVDKRLGREIIVVNDGSHDDAYEAVRADFADAITYEALPANVGLSRARNASAELASGDYLVFTDDDCEPPRWWLDWVQARLQWAPDLDVLAGPTRALAPSKWTFFSRVLAAHGLIPSASRVQGGVLFSTANAAIRRSLFAKLGGFGFPGTFQDAGEDTELAARISNAGGSICIDPNWFVRHEVTSSFAASCRRYWRYGYANGAILRLTTAPQRIDDLGSYRRRQHVHQLMLEYRRQRKHAAGVSRHRAVQIASALAASLVWIAYFDGCAAALRDRRRHALAD